MGPGKQPSPRPLALDSETGEGVYGRVFGKLPRWWNWSGAHEAATEGWRRRGSGQHAQTGGGSRHGPQACRGASRIFPH
eukprot:7977714-Prorocentrum_lima.AAC.1